MGRIIQEVNHSAHTAFREAAVIEVGAEGADLALPSRPSTFHSPLPSKHNLYFLGGCRIPVSNHCRSKGSINLRNDLGVNTG